MNYWDVPGFKAYFQRVNDILDELASMDIRTLANLNMIIPQNFKERISKVSKSKDTVTFTGRAQSQNYLDLSSCHGFLAIL
jgi:hypothetical protein